MLNVAIVVAYPKTAKWHGTFPLMDGFRELGHEVKVVNVYNDQNQHDFHCFHELLDMRYWPDLILVLDIGYIKDDRIHTRNYPCPIFGEMGDDPQAHQRNLTCAPQYDVLLTPQRDYVGIYKKLGWKRVYWWTHFYDHYAHKPYADVKVEYDVSTVMNVGGRRAATLQMLESQKEFTFANGVGREGAEYSKFLQSGKLIFNQSNHDELTRRVFEALASGRMLLTDRIPESTGIYDLFTPGVHLDIYDGSTDLLEKIRFYLAHDEDRERIARAGQVEVSKHSAAGRAQQIVSIFESMNGKY